MTKARMFIRWLLIKVLTVFIAAPIAGLFSALYIFAMVAFGEDATDRMFDPLMRTLEKWAK